MKIGKAKAKTLTSKENVDSVLGGRRPSDKTHGKGKDSLPFLLWLFGGQV